MDRPSLYEWDEAKRRANLAKHGVDFTRAEGFAWENSVVIEDTRRDHGEQRSRAFGKIGPRLYCLVFTPRGERVRVISLRKANPREIRRYAESK
jgi:uncharacterized DUF497 family protein